jgi:hypothetical protein
VAPAQPAPQPPAAAVWTAPVHPALPVLLLVLPAQAATSPPPAPVHQPQPMQPRRRSQRSPRRKPRNPRKPTLPALRRIPPVQAVEPVPAPVRILPPRLLRLESKQVLTAHCTFKAAFGPLFCAGNTKGGAHQAASAGACKFTGRKDEGFVAAALICLNGCIPLRNLYP